MNSSTKRVQPVFGWLVSILVPVVLVLSTVRLVLNPWFLEFEYHSPGFPADSYGFSLEDRLYWSRFAVDYLINDASISYLADLRFPEGQVTPAPSCLYMEDCTKLYNDRELQHMIDVKNVVQAAMLVWLAAIMIALALALWVWRGGWWLEFRLAIARGGWLTTVLMIFILLLALLAFNFIFVLFHEIFFTQGSWTFLYTDTLIRLFPERFWSDTFLMVGGIPSLVGIALGYLLRCKNK